MTTTSLVGYVSMEINRRRFLTRIAAGAISTAFTVLGLATPAEALCSYKCCTLCRCPSSCSGCHCIWCWFCSNPVDKTWKCCECYDATTYCNGGCYLVRCSYVQGPYPY